MKPKMKIKKYLNLKIISIAVAQVDPSASSGIHQREKISYHNQTGTVGCFGRILQHHQSISRGWLRESYSGLHSDLLVLKYGIYSRKYSGSSTGTYRPLEGLCNTA